MFYIFGTPYGINDLRGTIPPPTAIDRKNVPIAIIDDEHFPKLDVLQMHDFNVKEIGDIADIKAVHSYPIVLCDIKGVGKAFRSQFEGGHVIEEINRYYPSKVLIAYTGQQFDPTYNRFFRLCDYSVKKDLENDDWIRYLDESIRLVVNPISQWLRTRNRLIQMEISAHQLLRLEHEFVRRVRGDQRFFPSNSLAKTLPPDVKTIVLNLVSDLIFKAVIG